MLAGRMILRGENRRADRPTAGFGILLGSNRSTLESNKLGLSSEFRNAASKAATSSPSCMSVISCSSGISGGVENCSKSAEPSDAVDPESWAFPNVCGDGFSLPSPALASRAATCSRFRFPAEG